MKPLRDRDPGDETQMRLDALYPCPTCEGRGWIITTPSAPAVSRTTTPCLTCNGSGTVAYDPDDKSIPY